VSGQAAGGSPRAYRARPPAWPSPPGPLGWQRLQGQGSARRDATGGSALDAGGASPDNARRTGPAGCGTFTATAALGATLTAWQWCWRAHGSRIRRGPQAAGHRECRARQPPRRRTCVRRTRRSCRPASARPPVGPWPPTAGHPGRFPSRLFAPVWLFTAGAVRPGAPKVRP
jgi:hypothetical protein